MSPSPQTRAIKPVKEGRQPPKQTAPKKRQPGGRISAACEACKKRKTKCTGGPAPCQLCESLGTECIIDLTLDMRRRAALQRTIDESKSYQESLAGLMECLRDGDPIILESLTASLRKHPSPQELSAMIQKLTSIIRDRENESGFDDILPSPSEDSLESLRTSQRTPSLIASRENSFEMSMGATTRSSPSNEMTENDPAVRGDYLALIQQLRAASNVDGERSLRALIDPDNLRRFLRQSTQDNRPAQAIGDLTFPGYGRGSASTGFSRERRHWHPALQVREETAQTRRPTKREEVTNVSLAFRTTFTESNPWGESSSRSMGNPPSAFVLPSQNREFDLQRSRAAMTSTVLSPASEPYTEHTNVPIESSDSSLCIAQQDPAYRWRVPVHLILPLTIPDDSSMCRVYTEYLQAARSMIASGDPVSLLLGSNDDVIVDLLFRQRRPDDRWDCSSWACELFRSFTEYELSVRLANTFFLTRFMRWLLVPTIENYMKLPDMMKPTPIQRQVPHIGAIDLIPIPCIRDAAISDLRDWLTPLGEARWSVNWPYSDQDAMERDPVTGSVRLTPRFMKHVEQYENWSVGSSLLTAFPEAIGKINIHF